MTGLLKRRLDPEERAGLRLTLLTAGLLVVAVLVLPLAALVRDRWSPLAHLDVGTDAAAHRAVLAQTWLADLAKVLTWVGAPLTVELATTALVLWLVRRHRRRSALYLVTCVAGAYALSTIGKLAVARARPVLPDPISHARGPSFPSGHATGSAAFYLALAVLLLSLAPRLHRSFLALLVVVVPVVVAVTRVLLGVHYPTDVAAGLLLGWGWAAATTGVFTAWRADEGRPVQPLEEGIEPEPDQ